MYTNLDIAAADSIKYESYQRGSQTEACAAQPGETAWQASWGSDSSWKPSWEQWANAGKGGWTCTRSITWARTPVAGGTSARTYALGETGPGGGLVFLISGGLTYEMAPNTWGAASTDTDIAWCSITNSDITGAAIMDFGLRFEPIAREILNEPGIGDTAIRVFVLLWLLNGVIGTLFARIQRESTTAKEALETVVTQRRLLLESEERVRGQVAAYLHDRVQTDLVTIGLRIRAAVSPGPAEMVSEVGEALADLEGVRADKIRAASRQLSPNLEHVTLEESLRDLATTYRPAMAVTVSVNESAARELQLHDQVTRATAIYRICEQGLLNAAIHGHATECAIDVTRTPDDKLVLHLNDDGFGMQGDTLKLGMGMTVISAWVEALDGRWSLEPGSSGMTLTATFPCA